MNPPPITASCGMHPKPSLHTCVCHTYTERTHGPFAWKWYSVQETILHELGPKEEVTLQPHLCESDTDILKTSGEPAVWMLFTFSYTDTEPTECYSKQPCGVRSRRSHTGRKEGDRAQDQSDQNSRPCFSYWFTGFFEWVAVSQPHLFICKITIRAIPREFPFHACNRSAIVIQFILLADSRATVLLGLCHFRLHSPHPHTYTFYLLPRCRKFVLPRFSFKYLLFSSY